MTDPTDSVHLWSLTREQWSHRAELLQLPSDKDRQSFRVGDTIDVTIDLGFDLYKKKELELQESILQRKEQEILKKRSLILRKRKNEEHF